MTNLGMLFGGAIFGLLGDKIGRIKSGRLLQRQPDSRLKTWISCFCHLH